MVMRGVCMCMRDIERERERERKMFSSDDARAWTVFGINYTHTSKLLIFNIIILLFILVSTDGNILRGAGTYLNPPNSALFE